MSTFDEAGGEQAFFDLIDRFFERLEQDPIVRPFYPEDLGPPRRHLALFLIQYFGGPRRYTEERGHPALPVRHKSFQIDRAASERWAELMTAAVMESEFSPDVEAALLAYVHRSAAALTNHPPSGFPIRPHPGV